MIQRRPICSTMPFTYLNSPSFHHKMAKPPRAWASNRASNRTSGRAPSRSSRSIVPSASPLASAPLPIALAAALASAPVLHRLLRRMLIPGLCPVRLELPPSRAAHGGNTVPRCRPTRGVGLVAQRAAPSASLNRTNAFPSCSHKAGEKQGGNREGSTAPRSDSRAPNAKRPSSPALSCLLYHFQVFDKGNSTMAREGFFQLAHADAPAVGVDAPQALSHHHHCGAIATGHALEPRHGRPGCRRCCDDRRGGRRHCAVLLGGGRRRF